MVLLLAALACTSSPPPAAEPPSPAPAAQPAMNLGAPAATVAWRALDALDTATFALPARSTPDGPGWTGRFPLAGPWTEEGRRVGRLQTFGTPLPFECEMPRPNYPPMGARLFHGDAEVPFGGGLSARPGELWWVEKGEVKLLGVEAPGAGSRPWELRVPELATTLARRSRATSGLADAAFAAMPHATVGAVTRPAVYLPAPGSAAFPVDVPPGARLDLGVALLDDPVLAAGGGDGADAVVLIDGEEVWRAPLAAGEPFTDTGVDLGRWAGKRVTLTLRSDPRASGDYDYVVWSAPTLVRPPQAEPRHVVIVGIDTLRWDALGLNGRERDTSPELDAWAKGAVVFDQARAPAPRTRPSFRTAFTGRYPLAARSAPALAEVLEAQGFRAAGFAANVHLVPRFGFDAGFEHWHYQNGARAEDQVAGALEWMRAHQDEDTYVFVHIMDPHTWYNAPAPYGDRFGGARTSPRVPEVFDRWEIVQATRRNALKDTDKALIRDRYDGEVAYTSHALAALFAAVDELNGRTITVLHSDHGEEFWDHGAYEHNHSLYDELVRALFAVRPPGGWADGPHRVPDPVGLQDLVPTVLDLLDIPAAARPPTDGVSLRPLLDAARATDAEGLRATLAARPLVQGHLMFERERWSVVLDGWKYILHTASGQEEVYDLRADPGEHTDLAAAGAAAPVDAARLDALRAGLSQGLGWPVTPGWRVELKGRLTSPLTFTFDAPVLGFGVIDPEADRPIRANLEWGERPELTIADVGVARLAADRASATFQPGAHYLGQRLYVACDGPCPTVRLATVGNAAVLMEGVLDTGAGKLEAHAGTVIVVPEDAADTFTAATDAGQMEALRALGYVAPD